MQGLTPEGQRIVKNAAKRHNVSDDAAYTLLMALAAGGGRQAQFNHPDLGGIGQWSQGGMIMIGDIFNNALKYRVDALCNELAMGIQNSSPFAPAPAASSQSQSQSGSTAGASLFVPGKSGNRWPAELGAPGSAGSQNNLHYAVFPASRRLAIEQGGRITIYDTGDHRISGFSQQQSGGKSLTFTSQKGLMKVADLPVVGTARKIATAPKTPAQSKSEAPPTSATPQSAPFPPQPAGSVSGTSDEEIFSRLERLADLRKKDVITVKEFEAKKAELLARL